MTATMRASRDWTGANRSEDHTRGSPSPLRSPPQPRSPGGRFRLGRAVIKQRIDDGTIRDLPPAAAGRNACHDPFKTLQVGNLAVNCGDMIAHQFADFGAGVGMSVDEAQQLLVNGGFETGSISPWTASSGVLVSSTSAHPA